jgi:uncharacterized SAM-binding protein YcdF (DUF218 family)
VKSLAILMIAALIWGVGLATFASRVEMSTPAPEPEVADAVVALTGGSSARLEEAMKLLERGRGRRLLISGVDPAATPRRHSHRDAAPTTASSTAASTSARQAEDTIGNARETAEWARPTASRKLIIAPRTSTGPRSLSNWAVMPEAELLPQLFF